MDKKDHKSLILTGKKMEAAVAIRKIKIKKVNYNT